MDQINQSEIPVKIVEKLKDILFDHAQNHDASTRKSGLRLNAAYEGFVASFETDSQCFDLLHIETALKHGDRMEVAPMSNPDALSLWEEKELLQDGFSFEVKLAHVVTFQPKPGADVEAGTMIEFVGHNKSNGSPWAKHNGLTFGSTIGIHWRGAYADFRKSRNSKRFEVVIRPISDNKGGSND